MARTTSSGLGQCCNVVDFISIHTTCLIAKEAIWREREQQHESWRGELPAEPCLTSTIRSHSGFLSPHLWRNACKWSSNSAKFVNTGDSSSFIIKLTVTTFCNEFTFQKNSVNTITVNKSSELCQRTMCYGIKWWGEWKLQISNWNVNVRNYVLVV